MNKKILTALRESIKKWEKKASNSKSALATADRDNCPLCKLCGNNCAGCPVKEKTRRKHCKDTPYDDWCGASYFGHGDPHLAMLMAQHEVDFLTSLLPRKA